MFATQIERFISHSRQAEPSQSGLDTRITHTHTRTSHTRIPIVFGLHARLLLGPPGLAHRSLGLVAKPPRGGVRAFHACARGLELLLAPVRVLEGATLDLRAASERTRGVDGAGMGWVSEWVGGWVRVFQW